MFATGTDKRVREVIELEYKNAVKHYGATYKDDNEAREVLVEEMIEAKDDVYNMFYTYGNYGLKNLVEVEELAMHAMKELAQVCAVIKKIKGKRK